MNVVSSLYSCRKKPTKNNLPVFFNFRILTNESRVTYVGVRTCSGLSLYAGQTLDIGKRLQKHNGGLVKTTCARAAFELGYFEEFETRGEAMWRERELKKKYNTDRKKRMIAAFDRKRIDKILGL